MQAHLGIQLYMSMQVNRCINVWVYRCIGVQVYGCASVQVCGCTGMYNCTGVQLYRCKLPIDIGVNLFYCDAFTVLG